MAALCAVLLAACTTAESWSYPDGADNPLVGTILDVAARETITESELMARLGEQDFVLLGEVPGNGDQARLSARIVGELARGGRRLAALAMESLPTDTQPLIVEYLASHPGDGNGLDRALKAAAPDRPHLAQFTPALKAAVRSGTQVVAADLSADALRAVLTHGYKALQPGLVRRTGLTERFATPMEESLRAELVRVSCAQIQGRALDALVLARRARDATMADRLAAVTGRGQSVLVAADSHARIDRGVPWYLRQLRPGARIASLAFVELADAAALPPTDLPYDYAWFTPASRPPGYDACAELRRHEEEHDPTPAGGGSPPSDPVAAVRY